MTSSRLVTAIAALVLLPLPDLLAAPQIVNLSQSDAVRAAFAEMLETGAEDAATDPADALTAAGDHEGAAVELKTVEETGRANGGKSLVARAVGMLGSVDELAGRARDAQVRYEEAASLAAQAGDAPGYRRWLSASKTLRASI